MMYQKFRQQLVILISFTCILVFSNLVNAESMKSQAFLSHVDAKGKISLPADFRRTMIHLGSWFVPEGGASGFHDVYANAAAVDHYRNTGKWPDGATLVKELRGASSGSYTTGKNVNHATEMVKQWFVMVKDTKGRFANNKNWGDGWGWALFKTDNTAKNVSTDYKTDCLGCHIPAKETDWIYVQGLPTLTSNK